MKKLLHRCLRFSFYVVSLVLLIYAEGAGQRLRLSRIRTNPTLRITTGIPDGQLIDVVNTGASLRYSTPNYLTWKITVRTTCMGQSFTLHVVTTDPERGTSAGEVTLISGAQAIDFITGIPGNTRNADATLQYTASATFDQGHSGDEGNDRHTVTYTIQRQ